MREALFQLRRAGRVVTESVGNGDRKAAANRLAGGASRVDVPQAIRANRRVGGAEIRVGVGVSEDDLVRLVVPLVAKFKRHIARQFTLHNQIPLVYQRIAEIGLNSAKQDLRIPGERTRREAADQAKR